MQKVTSIFSVRKQDTLACTKVVDLESHHRQLKTLNHHATIIAMDDNVRGITWEALEHYHEEKRNDWFWALGIVTVGAMIAAVLFGNTLFGILIGLAGTVMGILAMREPKVIPYEITQRGVRIDDKLFPYSTLESYFIDEDNPAGPQLLVKSEKLFMPLIIIPVPDEYLDEIEDLIADRLPEETLEEPFIHKVLEFFGF